MNVFLILIALAAPAKHAPKEPTKAATKAATTAANPLESFLAQRQYQEGLAWLHRFGKGGPDEQRYRGLFHHGLAQPDPTLEALVPIYRAHPTDDVVALAVAEASLWKKDLKTAVTVTSSLQQPEAPEALRVRGMLLEQAGRLPEALALYDKAIPKLALPWGAMERKAQVLSWCKRFPEASALYQQVVASPQASKGLKLRCRVRLAELSAWQRDLDGALAQLDKLLGEEPKLTDALLLQGQVLEWKGDFAGAKRSYSRALAVDAGAAEARLRLDKLLWVK